ncbi:MAG TPA: alpha-xylosidase [Opitutaceae bacterium]|nr:alpha-xylosidase [Opitutaceae bacterium]
MKFIDGAWLMQPGVQAHFPTAAHDLHQDRDTLVVHAPTHPVRHRGDTLQGPVLTFCFSAPIEGVIRVRMEHFSGVPDRLPLLTLAPQPGVAAIAIDEQVATVTSGELQARIRREDGWNVTFVADGAVLTQSGARDSGWMEVAGTQRFLQMQLSLAVGECVYGLGERFTAFVKNGQVVENTNRDGGTGTEQAYKAVPFYLTNRGYGVLVNETGPVSFEVATEKVSRVQFSIQQEHLEFFLIYGPTPKDILRRLTALTGRPALPPPWSFGLWLSTSFLTNYDEATVMSFIDGMRERDIPLHVFHFDCFWMREYRWCDFEWDPRVFPDPAGLLRRLHDRGLKVCVWINPYIAQQSTLFAEGRDRGYFLHRPNGEVWQSDLWQPGMAIVDFTNPGARTWYTGHLRRLLALGVDCFKTDFGERIPTDVVYHDRSDPVRMHNFYSVLYNETVFRLLEEVRGTGDAVVFARASYATGQRFPVHWGGDCWSNFESMAESLRGGLSLGLCGFGFWSHDIGGFEGLPPAAVYKRWVAFGLLSSHSRLHGSTSYRVPWNYDQEACDVLRFFTRLKCRLMPYLWAKAVEAHRSGLPVMRAMLVEFPGDPAADTLDRQFMLGDALLVAPVLSENGDVSYYLPEGRWTHLLTGEVQSGGRWQRARHGFLSLPLFVRPATVLALGGSDDRPDYDLASAVTFRIYELADGARADCVVPDRPGATGTTCTVERRGSEVTARLAGAIPASWRLQVAGATRASSPDRGACVIDDPLGTIVAAADGAASLLVRVG